MEYFPGTKRKKRETIGHTEVWYWPNGSRYREIPFIRDNGDLKPHGIGFEYRSNGTKRFSDHYNNGHLELLIHYYESGAKKKETPFKDEKENGLVVYYYESGAKKSEVLYKDGKEQGLKKYYTEDGVLEDVYRYKDGKFVGDGAE